MCIGGGIGHPNPPTVSSVSYSSVTLTFSRPAGSDPHKVVKYSIKYRKVGQHAWHSTQETTGLSLTVSGLQAHSVYQFKLAVRYQGSASKAESATVQATTSGGHSG